MSDFQLGDKFFSRQHIIAFFPVFRGIVSLSVRIRRVHGFLRNHHE
jgi:hypothetical protein